MADLVRACVRLIAMSDEYRAMGRDLPLHGASDAMREVEEALEAMLAEQRRPLSMGCSVEWAPCSICGGAGVHVEHPPVAEHAVQLVGASVVSAPECLACGTPLEAHDDRDWVCREASCDAEGIVVLAHLTGVFPARLSP